VIRKEKEGGGGDLGEGRRKATVKKRRTLTVASKVENGTTKGTKHFRGTQKRETDREKTQERKEGKGNYTKKEKRVGVLTQKEDPEKGKKFKKNQGSKRKKENHWTQSQYFMKVLILFQIP